MTSFVAHSSHSVEQYVYIEYWAYADRSIGSYKPREGYVWLLVGMSIENHGYDSIPLSWNNFYVTLDNWQFNAHGVTYEINGYLSTPSLLDGLKTTGYLVYEVPGNYDLNKYTLVYKPETGNYNVKCLNEGVQIRT
jgi:hypothetical protein